MTYCAGILVQDGLVMIADTRTNAGLDNISTFRKLHVFSWPGDRTLALATAEDRLRGARLHGFHGVGGRLVAAGGWLAGAAGL